MKKDFKRIILGRDHLVLLLVAAMRLVRVLHRARNQLMESHYNKPKRLLKVRRRVAITITMHPKRSVLNVWDAILFRNVNGHQVYVFHVEKSDIGFPNAAIKS